MQNQQATVKATLSAKIEKFDGDPTGAPVETVVVEEREVELTLAEWTAHGGAPEAFAQKLKEQGGN